MRTDAVKPRQTPRREAQAARRPDGACDGDNPSGVYWRACESPIAGGVRLLITGKEHARGSVAGSFALCIKRITQAKDFAGKVYRQKGKPRQRDRPIFLLSDMAP